MNYNNKYIKYKKKYLDLRYKLQGSGLFSRTPNPIEPVLPIINKEDVLEK